MSGSGRVRAQRYLDAARHKKRYVDYETSAQNLTIGDVLRITEHPHGELDGRNLLTIETMTRVSASGEWTIISEAVFCDVPYRKPRVTPRPRVRGVQSGIVCGPKGEDEIYTDEFGRVRVRFHWDREGDYDDNRTCWLRVSQAWAGAQYGTMMVPRIGQEVLIDFMDGDPDHPIVVGRIYNQPSPAAFKLPDHATRSIWQSDTTPNQEGKKCFNEIMFEDLVEEELVSIQAERNLMSLTKRNETERTGNDRTHIIGRDRLHVVGKVDSVHAPEQMLVQMVNVSDIAIKKKKEPKYNKTETFFELKDQKVTLTTGDANIVLDGPDITVESAQNLKMTAGKTFKIMGGMVFINAMGGKAVNVKAMHEIKDRIPEPEGRVLNSIIRLFAKKEEQKQAKALVDAQVTDPSLPAPVATGTLTYYQDRLADFRRRHPDKEPPDYYLGYGNKYLQRFWDRQDLSPKAREWMERTLKNLQEAIEEKRALDPLAFEQLELDNEAFRRFAYDTHPKAYLDAGLLDLSAPDLVRVGTTPDIGDLLTKDGISQVGQILGEMKPADYWNITKETIKTSDLGDYADMAKGVAQTGGKAIVYGAKKLGAAASEKAGAAIEALKGAWGKVFGGGG